MWRAVPLAKVLLRMTAFGAILGATLGVLTIFAFEARLPAPKSYVQPRIILGGLTDGLILGGMVGVVMALYAAVAHRTIHKPARFRFAMLIVALIVSLAVVQPPFDTVYLREFGLSPADWFSLALGEESTVLIALYFGTIAKHVAIGLMSLFVASHYLREASAQYMKSTGQATT